MRPSLALLLTMGTASLADFTFDELWSLQNTLWENFLYPANLQQINATDTSVFAEDVQGRVDITRTFDGRELNNEYIFGLFSDPDHLSLVGIPISYNITQFSANQNITAATTVFTFNATSFNTLVPITIDTWILYNPDGKIAQYDATFRWFDWLLDTLSEAAGTGLFNTTDPAEIQRQLAGLLATTICETHDQYCLDENKQYETNEACVDFLTNTVRFGKAYELGRNTLLCREVHEHMVQYRPTEHCPHIGPSGGGYCVDDKDYATMVTERYFKQPFIPFGYGGDNVWLAGA
ncbi:hypothetical protein ASPVEDRAFT_166909 [Aspergillus versicolor CBS 583.65]|uniref:Uncharacterized protein n=1 Tax=Aspergillus versicolor CBS 583.65 TaxID=1036611 RepID=A0A1L9PID7_ASPVE|nr:uncharacterized protein ASPVEDRAFT_166909 [Aspergillus versicolor CBS 583.65]OJJ01294.1 hypothetical protein ASPVEDRAFT_166909 [Aspergillus versicolor CBS 583.65]